MNTVTFGTKNSFTDYDLLLTSKTLETPKPKYMRVDVPGADGELDFTEYFGEVVYNNRKLSLEFSSVEEVGDFPGVYADFANAVHGKRMKVLLSDEPGWYFMGRVEVGDWKIEKGVATLPVEVDCEPYRYKDAVTSVTTNVSGTKTVTYTNSRKSVVPTFTLTAAMGITFGGSTYQVSAGTYSNDSIRFVEGNNQVTYSGSGAVTVTYQEKRL